MRRVTVVLLLMLALLPLRGWTHAAMAIEALPSTALSTSTATPPCHEAGAGESASPAKPACTVCDLCHAPLALALPAGLTLAAPRRDAPPAAAERRVDMRPPGRLERPPRFG